MFLMRGKTHLVLFSPHKAVRDVWITIAMTTKKFIVGTVTEEKHARVQVSTKDISNAH